MAWNFRLHLSSLPDKFYCSMSLLRLEDHLKGLTFYMLSELASAQDRGIKFELSSFARLYLTSPTYMRLGAHRLPRRFEIKRRPLRSSKRHTEL